MLDIDNGHTSTLSSDSGASEPKWLHDGTRIVWLKATENGNTSFIVSDALSPGKAYTAGTVSGRVSGLRLVSLEPGTVAIAVAGRSNPDESIFNEKDQPKSHSSARLYNSLFVRHWDEWVGKQRNTIFTALLKRSVPHVMGREGVYHLVGLKNALLGTGLESPIPTFGGTDNFDIGPSGLTFVAKDPKLNPALHTRCICYYLPHPSDHMELKHPQPIPLEIDGLDGACSSPVFSPDGQNIAVLQMKQDGYESDRNVICLHHDLDDRIINGQAMKHGSHSQVVSQKWDRSPNSMLWSGDGQSLFITVEDIGCNCLYSVDLRQDPSGYQPRKLTNTGNITGVELLSTASSSLFISSNSLISNSTWYILDPIDLENINYVSPWSNLSAISPFGLSRSQVSSTWFKGAVTSIHMWIVKPSYFNSSHKYPLAYFIHGGPQGNLLPSSTHGHPTILSRLDPVSYPFQNPMGQADAIHYRCLA